jgi:hypothetical protein
MRIMRIRILRMRAHIRYTYTLWAFKVYPEVSIYTYAYNARGRVYALRRLYMLDTIILNDILKWLIWLLVISCIIIKIARILKRK